MDLILRRDNSTSDRSNRRYRPKRDQVTISSARSGATQNTPFRIAQSRLAAMLRNHYPRHHVYPTGNGNILFEADVLLLLRRLLYG